jgi:serine/threonine protein kinase
VSTLHQSLGRYRIEAEIGRGGMGVVYRAYDPQIGRTVAIKTISLGGPEFSDQQYHARFMREARAAGRLSHPGIVTIYDAGEDPETAEPYLVMEYVAGQPLSQVLARERKLPLAKALEFAQEIAEALDYAHNQGVVHRDIKPHNILITEDGHAKIADFGVAWLSQEVGPSGEIVGSPAYMAPEQMAGKRADARSDLFSLGVVLYAMITGFRPFQGNSAKTVVFKVMNIEPVPVTSFLSNIPPELNAIVSRAIAKNPDERYPSGAALARTIQAFRQSDFASSDSTAGLATAAPPSSEKHYQGVPWLKTHRRVSLIAAVTAIVLGGAILGWRLSGIHRVALPAEVMGNLRVPPIRTLPAATARMIASATAPAAGKLHLHAKSRPLSATSDDPQRAAAKVQVEIRHRFNGAKAAIWVDDNLVSRQDLMGASHSLLHSVDIEQVSNFEVAPGKHLLNIHIVFPANHYDQAATVSTDLAPGSAHVLYVLCEKHKVQATFQ